MDTYPLTMHSVHTTNQFLSVFNTIDAFLSKQLGIKKYMPYSEKIDRIIQLGLPGSHVVDQYQSKFLYFGELRNQLVHGFSLDQRHLVMVSDYAVRQIQTLYTGLTTPPTAGDLFAKHVYQCQLTDSLGDVITTMRDQLNTHVPVYDGKKFVEVLSESTIAYWIADQIKAGTPLSVNDLTVSDVPLVNTNDSFAFVSVDTSIYDIKERFMNELQDTKRLGAIFITDDGETHSMLRGVVTAMDLHILLQAQHLL